MYLWQAALMSSNRVLLLATQVFQLLESSGLPDVFPEDGDIDVFGEAFD
jgi:hypothetical protein